MATHIMKYPNEPQAILMIPGGATIRFGYTFAHHLVGVLSGAACGAYQRELQEFTAALRATLPAMANAQPAPLAAGDRETLVRRYHTYGHGYYSSWMNEDDPWPEAN